MRWCTGRAVQPMDLCSTHIAAQGRGQGEESGEEAGEGKAWAVCTDTSTISILWYANHCQRLLQLSTWLGCAQVATVHSACSLCSLCLHG